MKKLTLCRLLVGWCSKLQLVVILICTFLLLPMGSTVKAKTFDELLMNVLQNDPRILQAKLSHQISENSYRSSWGEWLPAVDLSGAAANEPATVGRIPGNQRGLPVAGDFPRRHRKAVARPV